MIEAIRICIIITTYNRPDSVASIINQLTTGFNNVKEIELQLPILIVNNGNELKINYSDKITLIQNPNLGGSGGFARGLYEASKDPSITHCLFMDDDAACDISAIIKTYQLLAESDDSRLALAGSMVYEHKPWVTHESGARMFFCDMAYRANKHDLDLRTAKGLTAFHKKEQIDYGGWWFYAFPIRHTPHYPFPFFVRGDDVLFGLMNSHEIKTDINIISKQMCFLRKFTPWVIYLVFRACFVHGSYRKKRLSPLFLLIYFNFNVLRYAFGYRYTMALAIINAFEDGNKGLRFWRENMDALEPMARIKSLQPEEIYNQPFLDIPPQTFEGFTPFKPKTWTRQILSIATLGGHLIPSALLKKKPYAISETLLSPRSYAFGRSHVLMINETTGKTMTLKHSKKLFFTIMFKMGWLSFKSLFTLNKTMKAYHRGIPSMCTREFWEEEFRKRGCFDKSP